jgi:hypothetical protein
MSKPATSKRLQFVQQALLDLRDAQEALRLAGAIQARRAVARARKSVEGAYRHAQRLDAMGHDERTAMKRRTR